MFKKILMAALVLASFTFAETFGVHAAGHMSNQWGDDADNVNAGLGFSAGFAGKFAFKDLPIAISPEVLIDMRNVTKDGGVFKDISVTEWALEIPVMVRLDLLKLFYVGVGPTFAFNLDTYAKDSDGEEYRLPEEWNSYNTFEFGLAFAVGTGMLPYVDVDFRVNLGLTDIYAEPDSKLLKQKDAKNLQFALGVSFWVL